MLYVVLNIEFSVEKLVHVFGELSLADFIEGMLLKYDFVENDP